MGVCVCVLYIFGESGVATICFHAFVLDLWYSVAAFNQMQLTEVRLRTLTHSQPQ